MSSKARRVGGGDEVTAFPWEAAACFPVTRAQPAASDRGLDLPSESSEPQRAATVERDAFAKGYAQGERAGLEAAATRGQAMLRRLGETVQELTALRAEIIQRSERQVVQLAMAIAERMINREISLDRGLVCAMARVALDRLGENASAAIRLHPDDFAAVSAGLGDGWKDSQITIAPDPMVSRGGCRVHSDFGFMDVDVASQFRELSKTLFDEDTAAPAEVLVSASHGVSIR